MYKMNRTKRHLLLQKLFWSPWGVKGVVLLNGLIQRWNYVVMNRSLLAEANGEYWLISRLPKNALVFDIGFNAGDFTSEVLRQKPEARIFGFEAARSMLKNARAKFGNEKRLELVPLAVSNADGTAEFSDSADGCSSLALVTEGEKYEVKTIRLDSFASQHDIGVIDFVKIDVEGYDLHVLEGAGRLMDEGRIKMFTFEYNAPWIESGRFLKEAYAYVESKNYTLFRLFNGFVVPYNYSSRHERHDLGCNYVGISKERLAAGDIPQRSFPE
jgi:FkbM family methyltransferase